MKGILIVLSGPLGRAWAASIALTAVVTLVLVELVHRAEDPTRTPKRRRK